jgi:hypothetical protein
MDPLITPTHASGALIIFGGVGGGSSSTSEATMARLFTYVERPLVGYWTAAGFRRHSAPACFNTGGGFIKRQ